MKRLLVPVLFLLLSAGCTAQTLPAPDEAPEIRESSETDAVLTESTAPAHTTTIPAPSATILNTPTDEPAATVAPELSPSAETAAEVEESDQPAAAEPASSGTPTPEEVPQLELNPIKPGPEQKQYTTFARRDLAERLDVEIADIEVTAYEEVVWRDGSLGCPQPGMMYTQALVDGYLIQLVVDGQAYNYHGAAGRDPFLCVKDGEEAGDIDPGGYLDTPPVSSEDL